jgi:hypothetical protein
MRRAIATAATLAAVFAPATANAGPQCSPRLLWHTTRYKPVPTRASIPLDRRLGRGAIVPCATTRLEPGVDHRITIYAVRGVRPSVAIAVRPSKPALYVSSVRATAAERRVLDRMRGP